jgi:hypothetical protein
MPWFAGSREARTAPAQPFISGASTVTGGNMLALKAIETFTTKGIIIIGNEGVKVIPINELIAKESNNKNESVSGGEEQ